MTPNMKVKPVNLLLLFLLFPLMGVQAQNDRSAIPGRIFFTVDPNWQINPQSVKALSTCTSTEKEVSQKFLTSPFINIRGGDLTIDLKINGLKNIAQELSDTLPVDIELLRIKEPKTLIRGEMSNLIEAKNDELLGGKNHLKKNHHSPIQWTWPNAIERARIRPGHYLMFVNIIIEGDQLAKKYKAPQTAFFKDGKALIPHIAGAVAGMTSLLIGLVEEGNARRIYNEQYRVQVDASIADPILDEANSKYRNAQVFRWTGISIIGLDVALAIFRHKQVKKKMQGHNLFFKNTTNDNCWDEVIQKFSLSPVYDPSTGSLVAGLSYNLTF